MTFTQDVALQILSYLLPKEKYQLNREYYEKYHKDVYTVVYKKNAAKYIIDTIERDNAFVLSQIIADVPHIFRKRIPNTIGSNKTINMLKYCKHAAHEADSTKCQSVLVNAQSLCVKKPK